MTTKYIFVAGGVCSGLGKGIATASIGAILKAAGYKVSVLKMDPYLNVDPGTLSRLSNMTTGQVYQNVIARERHGEYLGKTIQIIPHITGAIKQKIKETAAQAGADFLLVEIGGTVGDIEGEPYLE